MGCFPVTSLLMQFQCQHLTVVLCFEKAKRKREKPSLGQPEPQILIKGPVSCAPPCTFTFCLGIYQRELWLFEEKKKNQKQVSQEKQLYALGINFSNQTIETFSKTILFFLNARQNFDRLADAILTSFQILCNSVFLHRALP